jgi:hypothetical protein
VVNDDNLTILPNDDDYENTLNILNNSTGGRRKSKRRKSKRRKTRRRR